MHTHTQAARKRKKNETHTYTDTLRHCRLQTRLKVEKGGFDVVPHKSTHTRFVCQKWCHFFFGFCLKKGCFFRRKCDAALHESCV